MITFYAKSGDFLYMSAGTKVNELLAGTLAAHHLRSQQLVQKNAPRSSIFVLHMHDSRRSSGERSRRNQYKACFSDFLCNALEIFARLLKRRLLCYNDAAGLVKMKIAN